MSSRTAIYLGGLGLLAGVALASSLVTGWLLRPGISPPAVDYHLWIHAELKLTEQQERRMAVTERRFEETERHLLHAIRLANLELAEAISEDRAHSHRVQEAVQRIQEAQGHLQAATLDHIFEMKAFVEPAQYDRLIALTAAALRQQAGEP